MADVLDYSLESHNPYFNRWFSAIVSNIIWSNSVYSVTILILIDGFLQYVKHRQYICKIPVTILILIDGFLQYCSTFGGDYVSYVTILILIDGFLQYTNI